MAPEIWMLLHEAGAFLRWARKFAPSPAILWLFSVEDDPVLPERK